LQRAVLWRGRKGKYLASGELVENLVEDVGLAQPVDLDTEVELVYDVLRCLGEASDTEVSESAMVLGSSRSPVNVSGLV
jgi:hypothetical protein